MSELDNETQEPKRREGESEPASRDTPGIDIDLDALEAKATPGKEPTREEKKQARPRLMEENETLRREAREATERAVRAETLALARATAPREERQAPGQSAEDKELQRIWDDQELLVQQVESLGARATPDQIAQLRARARELRKQEMGIAARSAAPQQRAANPVEEEARAVHVGLKRRHADVYANPAALQWAQGRFQQILAERNIPTNQLAPDSVFDDAFNEAKAKYRLGSSPPPTPTARQRMEGVPRGGMAGSGEGGRKVKLDVSPKFAQRMANAAYSHIADPKERLDVWLKKQGEHQLKEK